MPSSAGFDPLLRAASGEQGLDLDDAACGALCAWAALVSERGRKTNLVGTLEPHRLIDELIVDSLQPLHLVAPPDHIVDVGAGAGIPGVMLSAAWRCGGTMIEPRMKRAMFLKEVARKTGLALRVFEARLEELDDASLRGDLPDGASRLWVSRAVFAPEAWLATVAERATAGDMACVWLNAEGQLDKELVNAAAGRRAYRLQGGQERYVLSYEVTALQRHFRAAPQAR